MGTLGDGIVTNGMSSTRGSTKIDRHTGVVILEGEASFKGSTSTTDGVLLFSGNAETKGSFSRDCSNKQCENGGVGKDLGGEGSSSSDGKSVSPLGTFIGSASASGSRTIDENDIVTLEGTAGKLNKFDDFTNNIY